MIPGFELKQEAAILFSEITLLKRSHKMVYANIHLDMSIKNF